MRATCGFGHIYDSDQYATCPYCNRGARAIVFGNNVPGVQEELIAPPTPAAPSGIGHTVAPGFGGNGAADAGDTRADVIGKTVMPDTMREQIRKDEKNKTIGIFKKKSGIDPVVGWLVCIEGPDRGRDYRLYDRINMIGRSEENDVVLENEQTVSQKNHVRLAYDAKHNNFQIIPGDGHNIVYLNDMPLYTPQLLNAYDVMEMGETKLIFVPLCSDRFHWTAEASK